MGDSSALQAHYNNVMEGPCHILKRTSAAILKDHGRTRPKRTSVCSVRSWASSTIMTE